MGTFGMVLLYLRFSICPFLSPIKSRSTDLLHTNLALVGMRFIT